MAKRSDWLPSAREKQMDMAARWCAVMDSPLEDSADSPKKYTAWGIPDSVMKELWELQSKAASALDVAKNGNIRTEVANALVKTAFDALIKTMRSIKRRFINVPPLTEADVIALGLKLPDTHHAATGTPTAEFQARFFYKGPRQIGIILDCISGDPDDSANKEFRYYYIIVPHGAPLPAKPEETWHSFSSKRKRESLDDFEYGDSGNTLCMAVRVENGKKKGTWGPMTTVIIP